MLESVGRVHRRREHGGAEGVREACSGGAELEKKGSSCWPPMCPPGERETGRATASFGSTPERMQERRSVPLRGHRATPW
jgi:hypothetical protein